MLKRCFENVAPYIEHLNEIKKFVEENENKSRDEIISILEEKVEKSAGTIQTDYIILLNEVRRNINRETTIS